MYEYASTWRRRSVLWDSVLCTPCLQSGAIIMSDSPSGEQRKSWKIVWLSIIYTFLCEIRDSVTILHVVSVLQVAGRVLIICSERLFRVFTTPDECRIYLRQISNLVQLFLLLILLLNIYNHSLSSSVKRPCRSTMKAANYNLYLHFFLSGDL